MDTGLTGKRALVLGASKGLGFGIAQGLANEGARVAIASRTMEGSKGRRRQDRPWRRCPSSATPERRSGRRSGARRHWQRWVGVDILVLNSGGPPPGKAQGVSSDQWRNSFEAMFVNLVRIADQVLPGMIERKFGRIISVISSGVIQPIPNLAISNAIRPALVGWGKTLAAEVASSGVTVNAIAPGRIATDRLETARCRQCRTHRPFRSTTWRALRAPGIPAGRYGEIEEFARRGRLPRERKGVVRDWLDPACRWRSDFGNLNDSSLPAAIHAVGRNVSTLWAGVSACRPPDSFSRSLRRFRQIG